MTAPRRVLVTGAGGFIGQHVAAPLRKMGFDVHIAAFGPADLAVPNVTAHECNLLDAGARTALIDAIRPSHLLHLAWFVTHGQFWKAPENLDWVSASVDLVRKFVAAGGRRVVISGTCAEYEWTANTTCVENETPLRPATLYGASKDALRRVITAFCDEQSCSFAWGRIFFLYGPKEPPKRLVPSVILSLLRGQPALCTHGEQLRDFMHTADVGRSFCALLDSDVQGPVNIASGRPVRIRDVVARIGAELGRPDLIRLGALAAPPNDPEAIVADATRLTTEVGFKPQFGLEEGLRDVIGWWRSNNEHC